MKKILFILTIALTITLSSCQKDYTTEFAFWNDQTTSENLVAEGITELNYYIGNDLEGTTNSNDYYTNVPLCSDLQVFRIIKVSKEESETFLFTIEDQNDNILWQSNITTGEGCLLTEFVY